MSWTDDRVSTLETLWKQGLSASQVALKLGNVTRNAVIGKVHRLGLSGRSQVDRVDANKGIASRSKSSIQDNKPCILVDQTAPKVNIQNVTEVKAKRATTAAAKAAQSKANERKTILELTEDTCKWPIGEPGSDDFYFCGVQSTEGFPYCDHHAHIAYQPLERRKERRATETSSLTK